MGVLKAKSRALDHAAREALDILRTIIDCKAIGGAHIPDLQKSAIRLSVHDAIDLLREAVGQTPQSENSPAAGKTGRSEDGGA